MAAQRQIRQNCLLPKAAQGDVIWSPIPTFRLNGGGTSREEPHEHPDIARPARTSARSPRGRLFHTAGGFSSWRAAIVPQRHAVALFRTAAQGRAGALLHQVADRTLLGG